MPSCFPIQACYCENWGGGERGRERERAGGERELESDRKYAKGKKAGSAAARSKPSRANNGKYLRPGRGRKVASLGEGGRLGEGNGRK